MVQPRPSEQTKSPSSEKIIEKGRTTGCGVNPAPLPAHLKPLRASTTTPLWRTIVFTFVGILESFIWISCGAYRAYNEETKVWRNLLPFLIGSSWIHVPLLILLPLLMISLPSILYFGNFITAGWGIYGVFDIPLPSMVAQVGNLIAIFILRAIIVRMPSL
jgi:hypothetical protein